MLLATVAVNPVAADPVEKLHWEPLIQELMGEGFNEEYLRDLFGHVKAEYLPEAMGSKLSALYRRKFEPAPAKTARKGPNVYKSCLTKERIQEAREFMRANSALLRVVNERYGVPKEIAVSVLAVETRLGDFLGVESAFATLASMALARDPLVAVMIFPEKELSNDQEDWLHEKARVKGEWAYEELKALLEYAYSNKLDPLDLPGSVYGAIGVSQFMPSNALLFGKDGDADGLVNLFNLSDAVHSMANYLKEHGWKAGLSEKGQFKVLYRYNHSSTYANTIIALAKSLKR